MTRAEFMSELKHKLRMLPYEELHNAVCYYEEYFDEAGPQQEAAIIEQLGSPSSVASKIIGEYAVAAVETPETTSTEEADNTAIKNKRNILIITLLAVFASPIALPIAIAILVVPFTVVVVFFSIAVAGAATALGGVAMVGLSFWAFTQGFGTGLYVLGSGLLVFAIGASMALGTFQLGRLIMRALVKWMGRLLIRRGKNE